MKTMCYMSKQYLKDTYFELYISYNCSKIFQNFILTFRVRRQMLALGVNILNDLDNSLIIYKTNINTKIIMKTLLYVYNYKQIKST